MGCAVKHRQQRLQQALLAALLAMFCTPFFQSCSGDDGAAATITGVAMKAPTGDASLTDICRKWEWSRKGKIGAVDEAGSAVFHPEASGDDVGKYMFVSNYAAGHEGSFTPTEKSEATKAGLAEADTGKLLEGVFFTKLNEYVYDSGMTEAQKDAVTATKDEKEQFVKLNLKNMPSCGSAPYDVESMFSYRLKENGVDNSYLVLVESKQFTIVKMPALSTLKASLKTSLSESHTGSVDAEVVKVLKWNVQDTGLKGFSEEITRQAIRAFAIKAVSTADASLLSFDPKKALTLTESKNMLALGSTELMSDTHDYASLNLNADSTVYTGPELTFSVPLSDFIEKSSCSTLSLGYQGRVPVEFVISAMIKGLRQLMALAGGKLDPNLYYNAEMQTQFKTWATQYNDLRDTLKNSQDENLQAMGSALEGLVNENLSELHDKITDFENSAMKSSIAQLQEVLKGSKYDKSHLLGFLVPTEFSFHQGFSLMGTFGGMVYGHVDMENLPKKTDDYMNYFQKISNRVFLLPYKKKYQTSLLQPEVAMFGQDDPYEILTMGERRPNMLKGMEKIKDYLDEYGRIKDEGDTTTVFSAKCVDKKSDLSK